MNYIEQLNEFYSSLNYNNLSTNAIAIYQAVLYIAHKAGICEDLSIANTTLMSLCRLTIKELQNGRNELINKNYIKYKKGANQNNAPKYCIRILYEDMNEKIRQPQRQLVGQLHGQLERQPTGMTQGYINTLHYNTTLDLFFNYINNSQDFFENEKDKINLQDKAIIIMHLKRLRNLCGRRSGFRIIYTR